MGGNFRLSRGLWWNYRNSVVTSWLTGYHVYGISHISHIILFFTSIWFIDIVIILSYYRDVKRKEKYKFTCSINDNSDPHTAIGFGYIANNIIIPSSARTREIFWKYAWDIHKIYGLQIRVFAGHDLSHGLSRTNLSGFTGFRPVLSWYTYIHII